MATPEIKISPSRKEKLLEKFDRAVDIWITKPQVVNRKVVGANILSRYETAEECYKCENKFITDIVSAFSSNTNGDHSNKISVIIRRLLPRRPTHQPITEVIIKYETDIIFVPVFEDVSSPHTNPSYTISLAEGNDDVVVSNSINILTTNYEVETGVSFLSSVLGVTVPKPDWLQSILVPKLLKWMNEEGSSSTSGAFKVPSLQLVPLDEYTHLYNELKIKYGKQFTKIWPEATDPQKYVYEDVAIATYLLLLWKQERADLQTDKLQSFVDLGCGNGLLVHILAEENHPGFGIDVRKRKIWGIFGTKTNLIERAITPSDASLFPETDWIIGNHSDELTPWIPMIAARSSARCRYFVLPCCFYDFHCRYQRPDSQQCQYENYLRFIHTVGEVAGYTVLQDSLRIPSTKRICQIGAARNYPPDRETEIDELRTEFIKSRASAHAGVGPSARAPSDDPASVGLVTDGTPIADTTPAAAPWSELFQSRTKEDAIRNCSKIDKDLRNSVITLVAAELFNSTDTRFETDISNPAPRGEDTTDWNCGGSLQFQAIVKLFNSDVLKQMKNQFGGLKTLLKNQCQLFESRGDRMQIKNWAATGHSLNAVRQNYVKTRLCWHVVNHPQGCPLPAEHCSYAHSEDDVRTYTDRRLK